MPIGDLWHMDACEQFVAYGTENTIVKLRRMDGEEVYQKSIDIQASCMCICNA